eukprot:TRINITY_DN6683_c0_g1_i1.p1 TRINITY_DN6683_c0_g1~~TRINITY_DN6683_c0_g1_i1.p1  ORF type:complete len:172 (-),score=25.36 TRINITY_DN6683_c0_g1_i1:201-716(-)
MTRGKKKASPWKTLQVIKWKMKNPQKVALKKMALVSHVLGLFNKFELVEFLESLRKSVKEADYEFSDFCLSLKIPVSTTIRFYGIWYHLRGKFKDASRYQENPKKSSSTLKAVVKWILSEEIEKTLGVKFRTGSPFRIEIEFEHDESLEHGEFLKSSSSVRPKKTSKVRRK